jgi:hypothetical protein
VTVTRKGGKRLTVTRRSPSFVVAV